MNRPRDPSMQSTRHLTISIFQSLLLCSATNMEHLLSQLQFHLPISLPSAPTSSPFHNLLPLKSLSFWTFGMPQTTTLFLCLCIAFAPFLQSSLLSHLPAPTSNNAKKLNSFGMMSRLSWLVY
ncbi:hypothetical protein BCR33DRAFT_372906 [Rhizoclosmatium globosum]|uniref:Uncharacterized protein n=1 Tax=Rhizoclosmatium globosum TaxID=329046 RepID=A0A1Y2BZN9_9FUNG|nr:hypothetical protein BCR33DRAFT_372906 [Rhizoclosmatium globosum]|eukprot:ORY40231.1 hypothetical protein BCR33DRAFT_372906 [Rhizoclosmatium globosum]